MRWERSGKFVFSKWFNFPTSIYKLLIHMELERKSTARQKFSLFHRKQSLKWLKNKKMGLLFRVHGQPTRNAAALGNKATADQSVRGDKNEGASVSISSISALTGWWPGSQTQQLHRALLPAADANDWQLIREASFSHPPVFGVHALRKPMSWRIHSSKEHIASPSMESDAERTDRFVLWPCRSDKCCTTCCICSLNSQKGNFCCNNCTLTVDKRGGVWTRWKNKKSNDFLLRFSPKGM